VNVDKTAFVEQRYATAPEMSSGCPARRGLAVIRACLAGGQASHSSWPSEMRGPGTNGRLTVVPNNRAISIAADRTKPTTPPSQRCSLNLPGLSGLVHDGGKKHHPSPAVVAQPPRLACLARPANTPVQIDAMTRSHSFVGSRCKHPVPLQYRRCRCTCQGRPSSPPPSDRLPNLFPGP